MRFKSRINFNDYLKLNYTLTYKNRWVIYISIIGLLMLVVTLLYYSGLMPEIFAKENPPYFQLFFGLFTLVGIPSSIYFTAKKNFKTSERLQEDIEYEFTNDKFKLTGTSFSSEMTWDKTYKIQELKNWFLIYQNGKVANPISKRNLSLDQIEYLRNLFKNFKNVKLKLK